MNAERMPQKEPSFLERPLGLLTRLVVRAPKVTLLVAVALALAAIIYAATHLHLRTSRLDLLNPESGYNRLWLNFIDEFGDDDDAVIVVEGDERENVVAALEHVAAEVAQSEHAFHTVLHKVDLAPFRAKLLHYLTPDQLQQVVGFLDQVKPIIDGNWAGLNLSAMITYLTSMAKSDDAELRALAASTLKRQADNLQAALDARADYRDPWPQFDFASALTHRGFENKYMLAREGRLGLILLRLVDERNSFDFGTPSIQRLRKLLDRLEKEHPHARLGLTGLPIMENDEMRASQSASIQAAVLSLIGVACLFIVGFGGLRHPLLTVATLMLAVAWAFGYVALSVGHLNILSMSFGVILIGLGIDFGVHYVARYLHLRQSISASDEALVLTARGVGPGIVTGGVTTAIAFFAAGLVDFTGVAELGIIAGGGILLCIVAAIVVLPALIHLSDRNQTGVTVPKPLSVSRLLVPLQIFPRLSIVAALAATVFLMLGMGQLWYDHNLLNLQPHGLESVVLEQRLLDESDQSVWYAVSMADSPAELLARKQQFEALGSVQRTEEIVSLLPTAGADNAPMIRSIHGRLETLPARPPLIPVDPPADLTRVVGESADALEPIEGMGPLVGQLRQIAAMLRERPLRDSYQRLSNYQQRIAQGLLDRLHALRAIADPQPPQFTDLPPGLVERFVGRNGRHLLKVYGESDIWNMDQLHTFVHEVRSIDPRVTGKPLQTYEASRHMQRSYVHAALYALFGVAFVLILDFRSVRHSLLALAPVALGMLQMFGILGLLGIPLNPANMIVLPLILGIGLDDGVHVVHDFRCQRGRYRLSRSTATAVLITSLTTMVGFGTLMLADHRGLQSLGRVLTIGVSCCLFTSLVPLPALLGWITRNRSDESETVASRAEVASAAAPTATRKATFVHPKRVARSRSPAKADIESG